MDDALRRHDADAYAHGAMVTRATAEGMRGFKGLFDDVESLKVWRRKVDTERDETRGTMRTIKLMLGGLGVLVTAFGATIVALIVK